MTIKQVYELMKQSLCDWIEHPLKSNHIDLNRHDIKKLITYLKF